MLALLHASGQYSETAAAEGGPVRTLKFCSATVRASMGCCLRFSVWRCWMGPLDRLIGARLDRLDLLDEHVGA